MRTKATVVISILLGLLSVLMMDGYVRTVESQFGPTKNVMIADKDIQKDTVIEGLMIKRTQVPAKFAQPNATSDPKEVIGRFSTVPVPKGAQLVATYLEDANGTQLSRQVPRGRRAFTVSVSDATGVGGLVRPGDRVDFIGIFEYGRPTGRVAGRAEYAEERTETRTILQNVPIIAVGRDYLGERTEIRRSEQLPSLIGTAEVDAREARATRDRELRNVTVLVEPTQVQELLLAQHIGKLALALRSSLDSANVPLQSLDPPGLLKTSTPPKPRETAWPEFRGPAYQLQE